MTPHHRCQAAPSHRQPDKNLAFALDAVTERVPTGQRKAARVTANAIKDEIMAYLSPYATFYGHTPLNSSRFRPSGTHTLTN